MFQPLEWLKGTFLYDLSVGKSYLSLAKILISVINK